MPTSTFTTREPWTEGIHRLANTISQIMEAKRQQTLAEQQGQRSAIQDQLLQEQLNQIRRKSALEQEMRANVPKFTTQAEVPNPDFATQGVPYAPTIQQTVNRPIAEVLPELQQYVAKYGSPNDVLDFIQKQTAPQSSANPSLYARTITKPGPDGKNHYYGFNPETNQYDRDMGQVPEESFKYTGASIFRGADGALWRVHPVTGLPEKFTPGVGWKYDQSAPVPEFVGKELRNTPAQAISQGVQFDTIRGNISRVRKNFNPDWVGPVAGRAYRAQEALTGLSNDNQSMFYSDVNDLADMLLRARSGAQINEQEYNRLRRLVPTPDLPPKVFKERLNRFETQLLQAVEAQQQRLKKGRYLAPTPTPTGPEMKTESPAPTPASVNYGPATSALIDKARSGDKQAQAYLKGQGVTW